MFKYLLPFFLLIPAWSQTTPPVTPPAPPECLTRPVTLGSVTLSCKLLETDQVNGASDTGTPQLTGLPLFQVKLSSIDPDVIGFRVGVTFVDSSALANGLPVSLTLWGSVGKSPSPYTPQPAIATPFYRYTFLLTGTTITGIEVQELKVSNSQKF